MFGLFLLLCVTGVGGILFVIMVHVSVRQWLKRRMARQHAERYAVMVVEARRARAERVTKPAPAQQATLNAVPRGEITGVIKCLEESAAFKPIATMPAPAVSPRRVPRGTEQLSRELLAARDSAPPTVKPPTAPRDSNRATNPPPIPAIPLVPRGTRPPPLPRRS